VVQPSRTNLLRRVEVVATVEPFKRVDLNARVSGVVGYLPDDIDIGRKVKRGEILLRLAVPDLVADKKHKEALHEQAKQQKIQAAEALIVAQKDVEETLAEEKRFKANLEYHKLRHAQAQELYRKNAQQLEVVQEYQKLMESAQAALLANQARARTRQARVKLALADLEVAGRKVDVAAAEVGKVNEAIAFATITAPFDGEITKRWVDPGATIKDLGTPLLTVMQVDRVRVLIDVPQRDVPLVNAREQNPNTTGEGDLVTVRIPALAEKVKNGEFQGTITRTSKSLDPITRTMRAEINLDNKAGLLQPGMYGSASVIVETRYNVWTVPATALVRRGEGRVEVYTVADTTGEGEERSGVLRQLDVELGIDDGRTVEVRGLKGDELIVARGNGAMRAGERVFAVPARVENSRESPTNQSPPAP
jgi:RND family efflux transporter MFP subunit